MIESGMRVFSLFYFSFFWRKHFSHKTSQLSVLLTESTHVTIDCLCSENPSMFRTQLFYDLRTFVSRQTRMVPEVYMRSPHVFGIRYQCAKTRRHERIFPRKKRCMFEQRL